MSSDITEVMLLMCVQVGTVSQGVCALSPLTALLWQVLTTDSRQPTTNSPGPCCVAHLSWDLALVCCLCSGHAHRGGAHGYV